MYDMISCRVGIKKRGLSAPHQSSYTANVRINAVVCKCFQKFFIIDVCDCLALCIGNVVLAFRDYLSLSPRHVIVVANLCRGKRIDM